MAISKNKKKEVYDKVKDLVGKSDSVVFVNFHGLTVGNATAVRKALKKSDVGYNVAKKTIAKKVLSEAGITGTMPELPGELGLAYAKDLIAPAREVYDFQKKLDNKISIVGGVFEGRFMTKEEMTEIAQIPPLKTLYAQVVNLINSPIQGLAMAVSEIAKKKEGTPAA
jgi:large subunit ribosomal protein L10